MKSPLSSTLKWFEGQRNTVQQQIAGLVSPLHTSQFMRASSSEFESLRDLKAYMNPRGLTVNEELSRALILRSLLDYCISARGDKYWLKISEGFKDITESEDKGGLPAEFINSFPESFAEQERIWKQAARSWNKFKPHVLSNLALSQYEQYCLIKIAMSSRPTPYTKPKEFTQKVLFDWMEQKPDQMVSFLIIKDLVANKQPTCQTFACPPFSRTILERIVHLPEEDFSKQAAEELALIREGDFKDK